ncbi:hypothetical protein TeGR_g13683 [Tetraparma gracilis]|uniref:Uncharacterized protein n=1 Tax=Tetraparma gracilis TaxID=2962635 RepID=A0ABQ6MQ33_9STRA|nr:hypothetical protein TeGR_g13683 [Tetraparma gracilis]
MLDARLHDAAVGRQGRVRSLEVRVAGLSLSASAGDRWFSAARTELPWWRDAAGRSEEGGGTPYVLVLGAALLNGGGGAVRFEVDNVSRTASLTISE